MITCKNIMLSSIVHHSHHGMDLGSINMDSTSLTVYLAGKPWHAYTEANPSGNGNGCLGAKLGILGGGCQNLVDAFPGNRINCVDQG